MVLVGKKAPNFSTKAVVNGGEIVDGFSLEQFIGKKHVLFFFYPKDFTFVCPSELHAFQAKLEDFKAKGVEVVACSTDTPESHWGWLQVAKENGGIKGITYPIVADVAKTVAENFGVLAGDYFVNENDELEADFPKEDLICLSIWNFWKSGILPVYIRTIFAWSGDIVVM